MTTTPAQSKLWSSVTIARSFLSFLIQPQTPPPTMPASPALLAQWLIQQELGPFAYTRCKPHYPELLPHLEADRFSALAENSIHFDNLSIITDAFKNAQIPVVLLKGAAHAQTIYSEYSMRIMSDIDLWVQKENIPKAIKQLRRIGFITDFDENQPPNLQLIAAGQISFHRPNWQSGKVELQLRPLSGWWLKQFTKIDSQGMWQRKTALGGAYQLSPEDAILQSAIHLSTTHRFSFAAVRHFVDIALIAQKSDPDWMLIMERAKAWQTLIPVYFTFSLLSRLIEVPTIKSALKRLKPPPTASALLLQKIVTPTKILQSVNFDTPHYRNLLLLLMLSHPRNRHQFIRHIIWPEKRWLDARYPEGKTNWQHLRRLLLTRNP